MHTAQNFNDWVSTSEDYKDWSADQVAGADTSVEAYLDTRSDDEVKDLKEEYDEYCEEQDDDKDEDY